MVDGFLLYLGKVVKYGDVLALSLVPWFVTELNIFASTTVFLDSCWIGPLAVTAVVWSRQASDGVHLGGVFRRLNVLELLRSDAKTLDVMF